MLQKKEKIPPIQVVVPLKVKQVIEDEAVRLTRALGRKVTQGEIVEQAMWAYVIQVAEGNVPSEGGSPTVPSVPVPKGKSPKTVLDGANVSISVSEDELPWVNRLLAVLRSGKKIIVAAIKHNLNAFALFLTGAAIDEQPALDDAEVDPIGQALQDITEQAAACERDADALIAEHEADRSTHRRNRKRAG